MTATTLPRTADPTLPSPAERLAELNTMLKDPKWAADVKEIRAAIVYLTAITVLAA